MTNRKSFKNLNCKGKKNLIMLEALILWFDLFSLVFTVIDLMVESEIESRASGFQYCLTKRI